MRVITATEPATPGRINEDFVAASSIAVVLVDGAGNPPGADQGCHHGVAWYSRTLGTTFLNTATDDPQRPLTEALRDAITAVAALHQDDCDLHHPGSPSATVVAVRHVDGNVQHLVLADSVLVFDTASSYQVITDDREAEVGRPFRAAMDALPSGSPEHADALRRYVETMRAHRNRPGGFWVASSDPDAVDHARTGSTPADHVQAAYLLSDGASRLVDRFGVATWQQMAELVSTEGPAALIDRVRDVEHTDLTGRRWPRGKVHDDATVAHVHAFSA